MGVEQSDWMLQTRELFKQDIRRLYSVLVCRFKLRRTQYQVLIAEWPVLELQLKVYMHTPYIRNERRETSGS